jgi:para-nitrobenzyl esterase
MRALLTLVCAVMATSPTAFSQDDSPLSGTTWRLVKFEGGDGKVMRPPNPDSFTLDFQRGGTLVARVDCNRGRGSWKVTPPSGIEVETKVMTRAYCGPDSMDAQVLKHMGFIRSYTMKNGRLFLSLMADGGIYEYERVAARK